MERIAARLYLLFTPSRCPGDPWHVLAEALAGGVELVQWRVPAGDTAPPDGLQNALAACTAAGVPLIVNDDVEAAVTFGAAGAHVGQDDLPAAEARRRLGPDRWLGVSTHDASQVLAALAAGADHLGFGPCFPTATKGYTEGQPPAALEAALAAAGPAPVFAIGGITAARVPTLRAHGVRRVAVSSAILGADDPRRAAAALRAALEA